MTTIDIRLTDSQATLAGITRAINKHLGRTPLARVELRYSTQARVPLTPNQAKQTIANLLRESGHGTALVSVRAHEGPIDDATGEHVLRLTPTDGSRETAAHAQAKPPHGWRAWLARWLPWLFGGQPGAARVEPELPTAQPAVSRNEAVKKLREAVRKATRYVETDTGTAAVGVSTAHAEAVGLARVIVRLPGLHQALEPLVQNDTQAIAYMVKSAGLALAPDFRVSYSFQPIVPGDGTGYANESDVEVRLVIGPVQQSHKPALGAGDSARAKPQPSGTAFAGGTAMPAPVGRSPATTGVTVRVLGTLAETFKTPFVLTLPVLPARFDRSALETAGFARVHPELLAVASNSCPLHIRAGTAGALELHVSTRPGHAGQSLPMYFDAQTLAASPAIQRLEKAPIRLLVNAPGGVCEPVTGRWLPALVIEVTARSALVQGGLKAKAQLT